MLKKLILFMALAAGTPALAAQAPAAPPAAEIPPPDAERTAAAERFVSLIFPPGLMQRMMSGGMGVNSDAMMDMPMPAPPGQSEATAEDGVSFADFMSARDPHFRERMRIRSQVTNRIMGEVFAEIEPLMRVAMVEMFARRFTTPELGEMNLFFATPAGQKYAQLALTIMQDPALQRVMAAMMPRIMAAMPRVLREVATATAHLPPPPDQHGLEEGEEDEEQEEANEADETNEHPSG